MNYLENLNRPDSAIHCLETENGYGTKPQWKEIEGYIDKLEKEVIRLRREEEIIFAQLRLSGVPQERAKTISNGFDVYQTRIDKEIQSLNYEIKKSCKDCNDLITGAECV